MSADTKKIIFVGGSAFSGSTMLDMMLSNHPKGFSVGEVTALFRPHRPHHFQPPCGCGSPDCDLWPRVLDAGEDHLYQTVFAQFPSVDFIVDSSKHPFWIEKQARIAVSQGYEVHHLLIWKAPAAFAHSMQKRDKGRWRKHWKSYYQQYLAVNENVTTVSYAELAANPAHQLSDICSEIGIDYVAEQESFWNKQHHTLFGNDSAKIHLFQTSSSQFAEHGDKLSDQTAKSEHRNIYHDESYQQTLSPQLVAEIAADSALIRISDILSNRHIADGSADAVGYSTGRTLLTRVIYAGRRFVGRLLGRYFHVY